MRPRAARPTKARSRISTGTSSGSLSPHGAGDRSSAPALEELVEERSALVAHHRAGDGRPVIQPRVVEELIQALGSAALRVGGAVHDAGYAGVERGAAAHHARLHGRVKHGTR